MANTKSITPSQLKPIQIFLLKKFRDSSPFALVKNFAPKHNEDGVKYKVEMTEKCKIKYYK